jgi:thiol:disulfide interchange protein
MPLTGHFFCVVTRVAVEIPENGRKIEAQGDLMEIKFRHDVDAVLAEARDRKKPVLLDFSAAPM